MRSQLNAAISEALIKSKLGAFSVSIHCQSFWKARFDYPRAGPFHFRHGKAALGHSDHGDADESVLPIARVKRLSGARASDSEVWNAAIQLMKQFPGDPSIEAARRADRAYVLGDMVTFALWMRINRAVLELRRNSPKPGEVTN